MRRWNKLIGFFLIPALLSGGAWAATVKDVAAGGARGASMGGAFTAIADSADTLYGNPAGAAQIKTNEMDLQYAQLLTGLEGVGIGLNSLSFVHPLSRVHGASLGLAYNDLSVSGLYRQDTFLVSYSQKLNELMPWSLNEAEGRPAVYAGGNIKYLSTGFTLDSRTTGDPVFADGSHRDAYTADLGLLAKWKNRLSVGLSAGNVTQPNMGFQANDRVPMETRLGAAYSRNYRFVKDATVSTDLIFRSGDTQLALGWENWFMDHQAAFRAGWNDQEWALGLGYRFKMKANWDLGIDYAFLLPTRLVDGGSGTHRISAIIRFGEPKQKAISKPLDTNDLEQHKSKAIDQWITK